MRSPDKITVNPYQNIVKHQFTKIIKNVCLFFVFLIFLLLCFSLIFICFFLNCFLQIFLIWTYSLNLFSCIFSLMSSCLNSHLCWSSCSFYEDFFRIILSKYFVCFQVFFQIPNSGFRVIFVFFVFVLFVLSSSLTAMLCVFPPPAYDFIH